MTTKISDYNPLSIGEIVSEQHQQPCDCPICEDVHFTKGRQKIIDAAAKINAVKILKDRKQHLEVEIKSLIKDFEKETGLVVEEVELFYVSSVGSSKRTDGVNVVVFL